MGISNTVVIRQVGLNRIVRVTRFHVTPTSKVSPSFHYYREGYIWGFGWKRLAIATPEEIRGELC